MIRRFALLFVLWLAPIAAADHLVVSRHAHVKQTPERDGVVIVEAEPGDRFQLARLTQVDGYYEVLTEGGTGWIYRTLVRRYPGNLPEPGSATPAAPSASGIDLQSPLAFECLPIETNPNFPVRLIRKPYFVVGYSEERRNPLWVCYAIGPANDLVAYPRKRFTIDHETLSRVSHDDYTNSGYSRGHMAPKFALQSRFGRDASDGSFVMSNVCPQYQKFNDGQWGDLEEMIAGTNTGGSFSNGWADDLDHVWVIVGPIFDDDRVPLESGVEVPNAFYCIVVDEHEGEARSLAFVLEHEDERDAEFGDLLTSVRVIEARTGLDFFSTMPDDMELVFESAVANELWTVLGGTN